MPKEKEFYTDPSAEILKAGEVMEKVLIQGRYPVEIKTKNGHNLVGMIELDRFNVDEGKISIPFEVWRKDTLSEVEWLLIEKAKEMESVVLLSQIESDFDKLSFLGLDEDFYGRFSVNVARFSLEEIEFSICSFSGEGVEGVSDWDNSVRVVGLMQDFQEAFPEWEMKPMTLEKVKN